MRFLRYAIAAGAITVVAALLWVSADMARIDHEQRLNETVVEMIHDGAATRKASSIHYQTRSIDRRACGLWRHRVTAISVFKAYDPLLADAFPLVLKLKGLTQLRLTGETLNADSMNGLQRMPELRDLQCALCTLEGGSPNRRGPLLHRLELASSQVSRASLDALLFPGTIRELHIQWCDIELSEREIDLIASRLPQLEVLNLWHANLTDEGAIRVSRLLSLRELYLGHTGITDRALERIAALPVLEVLQVSETNVTDAGIRMLARMTSLREVQAHDCAGVTQDGLTWITEVNPTLKVRASRRGHD
jgi:hypothetical protein